MAGGTANKTSAAALNALAKMAVAKSAIQELSQSGSFGVAADPRHAAKANPAITAAITALQALT